MQIKNDFFFCESILDANLIFYANFTMLKKMWIDLVLCVFSSRDK